MTSTDCVPGALAGVRIIELDAKGPAPFGVMLLADLGADVVRVDRVTAVGEGPSPGLAGVGRGRRSIAVDLKSRDGVALVLRMVEGADVLVEGYRPGVAERLGLGPDDCARCNPRLVYARMTGWGQEGPLADRAAHDINFLAIAGALHPLGHADRPPPPPLNLIGDFGGGGTYLAIGILAALLERERSGSGQVVDAAMVDGVTSLLTAFHGLRCAGAWSGSREDNIVDGGAPWYRAYATQDGEFMAVGALEPRFYRVFLERLGLEPEAWPMHDRDAWQCQRGELESIFAARPRAHWERLFADTDACVTPVLTLEESTQAPHLVARGAFTEVAGALTPQAAPRLSRTRPRAAGPAPAPGAHTDEILVELGFPRAECARLRADGVVA